MDSSRQAEGYTDFGITAPSITFLGKLPDVPSNVTNLEPKHLYNNNNEYYGYLTLFFISFAIFALFISHLRSFFSKFNKFNCLNFMTMMVLLTFYDCVCCSKVVAFNSIQVPFENLRNKFFLTSEMIYDFLHIVWIDIDYYHWYLLETRVFV